MEPQLTIKQQFDTHYGKSSTPRERAKQYAYYTLPSLFPKEDTPSDTAQIVGMSDPIHAVNP